VKTRDTRFMARPFKDRPERLPILAHADGPIR
jgi:hypothetical protein